MSKIIINSIAILPNF